MQSSSLPTSATPEFQLQPVAALAWFQGRRFWFVLVLVLLISGLLFLLQTQTQGMLRFFVADISPALALLSAFGGSFWVSLRLAPGRTRLAWRYISLALLSYFLGEIIEAVNVLLTGSNPNPPSLSDPFLLAFYPLLVTGLLLLPAPALSRSARGRLLIDACILVSTVLGLSLTTIITPLLLYAPVSPTAKVIIAAYPLGDVALASTLILLLARSGESALRPIFIWMTVGIVVFLYADSAYNVLTLQGLYQTGSPLVDPFTVTGEFLIGLSAWFYLIHGNVAQNLSERLAHARQVASHAPWFQWTRKYLFPFTPLILLLFFVIISTRLSQTERPVIPLLEVLALFIIFCTITRQILLNNELVDVRVANERAQQLDNLKDQFITSVNHELRTPLMTMQTYIELLRYQQSTLPQKSGRLVEEIGKTNDALVDLVQSILEVRRIDLESSDIPREVVSLRHALDQALTLINPREGSMAERALQIDLPPELAIWGEPVRVQQILTNLLSNAIKYSTPGTAIEVRARMARPEGGRRSATRSSGSMVEIQVRDYGLGIPPEQMQLLFRRFVRLPRDLASNVVGSGLGLYLCKALAEAMGGQIRGESSGIPGEGTTFFLLLPLAQVSTDQPEMPAMADPLAR